MIVQIKGKVEDLKISDDTIDLDLGVESGLVYRIVMPSRDFQGEKGDQVNIYTSMQVREDSQVLYGFHSSENRDFFEKLLSVSGIGPRIGLGLLSMYSSSEITRYILDGDHKALSKAHGIGPKGAKKIILELAGILSTDDEEEAKDDKKEVIKELGEALSSLGFKGDERKKMLKAGEEIVEEEQDLTIEQLLQRVLRKE